MLDKLRIEFARSRPRRSNDNGLAEPKNGAVVRELFGYAHIPQRHANRFNTLREAPQSVPERPIGGVCSHRGGRREECPGASSACTARRMR
jgi:hypothetical protein